MLGLRSEEMMNLLSPVDGEARENGVEGETDRLVWSRYVDKVTTGTRPRNKNILERPRISRTGT